MFLSYGYQATVALTVFTTLLLFDQESAVIDICIDRIKQQLIGYRLRALIGIYQPRLSTLLSQNTRRYSRTDGDGPMFYVDVN